MTSCEGPFKYGFCWGSKSLGHAYIGLLLGFKSKFQMSISTLYMQRPLPSHECHANFEGSLGSMDASRMLTLIIFQGSVENYDNLCSTLTSVEMETSRYTNLHFKRVFIGPI